jgi:hypothetical protein
MSEKGELLACPFCGGAPAVEVVGVAGQNTLIYCEACHSDSHITCEAWAGVRAEAVSRWNTRTPQPAGDVPVEQQTCELCAGTRSNHDGMGHGFRPASTWQPREPADEIGCLTCGETEPHIHSEPSSPASDARAEAHRWLDKLLDAPWGEEADYPAEMLHDAIGSYRAEKHSPFIAAAREKEGVTVDTTDEQRAAMLKGVHGALLDAGLALGDIGTCEGDAVRKLAALAEYARHDDGCSAPFGRPCKCGYALAYVTAMAGGEPC